MKLADNIYFNKWSFALNHLIDIQIREIIETIRINRTWTYVMALRNHHNNNNVQLIGTIEFETNCSFLQLLTRAFYSNNQINEYKIFKTAYGIITECTTKKLTMDNLFIIK
jgi:hypothetical protein